MSGKRCCWALFPHALNAHTNHEPSQPIFLLVQTIRARSSIFQTFFVNSFNRRVLPGIGEDLLAKELNMFDATFLGVGATVGIGSFIFVGSYTASIGPAFILTNIFTALLILMSATCYADLIRRDNTCGGAYSTAFQQVGEIRAVFVGCLLSIEHILASALAARGISKLIDDLFGKWISDVLTDYMTFSTPFFNYYPDVLGCVISLCAIGIVSFDVKKVSTINNCCCLTNLGLYILITLVSGSNLNFENWKVPPSEECGNGGFLPYGFGSVFRGMSKVYISFLGFDGVANAGSEVRDSERTIPLSMVVAVIIVSVLFTLNSFTYTLVWSYCDQDIEIPIPQIMENIGLDIMKWITTVGLPLSMLGNFICHTYPLSRLVYAMAEDGMLCSYLSQVDPKTKAPMHALYISCLFTAVCVLFCSTLLLTELACLGGLSAYSLICYTLIYMSYTEQVMEYGETERPILWIIFNKGDTRERIRPTIVSSSVVRICCWTMFTTSFPFFLILKLGYRELITGGVLAIFAYVSFFVLYITLILIIKCQPLGSNLLFKKSTMPVMPVLVILINTYLSLEYNIFTWLIGGCWLLVAMIIYLTYGIWNSRARKQSFLL